MGGQKRPPARVPGGLYANAVAVAAPPLYLAVNRLMPHFGQCARRQLRSLPKAYPKNVKINAAVSGFSLMALLHGYQVTQILRRRRMNFRRRGCKQDVRAPACD
jgi:hypothetical protein